MTHLLPQIAIIGRANVGKSTLFNRLIEQNKALVSKIAGTTRDRNIATAEWRGRRFQVIDTGGLDINKKNPDQISQEIIKQSQQAINKANLILFVVDAKSGIIASDSELAKALVKNKQKDKTILVVNKADSLRWRQPSAEMYKLNLGQPNMLSAANGSGVGDLLDLIVSRLPADKKIKTEQPNNEIKVAIVGKPNVGKSSLLNSILGEERVMVTDIAHTTRESHDTEFIYKKNKFTLIDTAGISRDNKLKNKSLEKKSIDRSLETIAKADIVLLVTEVQKNISTQDKKITQAILENSKSVIIVANKWDLIPDKDEKTINRYIDYYQANFPYLWWAPIIFVSAKENLRTKKILDLIL
ncbi:MAG TPA: ribosome biogenesis GTPase Der, partial [bacterium]|nr:ribosome biogenesis GTPase Der [bacterium]